MNAFKVPYEPEYDHTEIIHFLWLRRSIGILGILLPFVLVVGNGLLCPEVKWLDSISAYYHTKMQNVFVGVLSVIAILLFTYRGPKGEDSTLSNLASLFCFGVAYFPTSIPNTQGACIAGLNFDLHYLHLISATGLFACFAYFAIVVFNKPNEQGIISLRRQKQIPWFKWSGYIILTCMALIAIGSLLESKTEIRINMPYTFILEWIALVAFGTSWVIKGDWIISGHPTPV